MMAGGRVGNSPPESADASAELYDPSTRMFTSPVATCVARSSPNCSAEAGIDSLTGRANSPLHAEPAQLRNSFRVSRRDCFRPIVTFGDRTGCKLCVLEIAYTRGSNFFSMRPQ